MSGRRRQLRPSIYQNTFHLDSDFATDENPARFELKLERTLHNIRIMRVHDVTFPQMISPFEDRVIRFTADEETYDKDLGVHPRTQLTDATRSAGTDLSPITATLSGNFSDPSHYDDIAYEMLRALHRNTENTIRDNVANPVDTKRHYLISDTLTVPDPDVHTRTGPDEVTNPFFNTSIDSKTSAVNAAGAFVDAVKFVPKIHIQINREQKTEIYSNFLLRLRPVAYDGNDEVVEDNLMNIMGFNRVNDPGVHEFLPILRGDGAQTYGFKGFTINGETYTYRLTSENPAEFQTNRYFYITTPTINLNTQDGAPFRSSGNVLCKIPITEYGSISNFSSERFHEHHVDINALDSVLIEVKNADGTTPDLQQVKGLSLTLRLWYDGQ